MDSPLRDMKTEQQNKERARIIELIKTFPLSPEFAFNDGWWEVGYKALDEVAHYLEIEDKDNAAKNLLNK